MKLVKNEKGVAMPLVLVILLVFTFLGTSLWQYSMTDTLQVARAESNMKAFYIARSGAEATAAWMKDKNNSGSSLIDKVAPSNTLGDGTYTVEVNKEDPSDPNNKRVIVKSTATVNGVSVQSAILLSQSSAFAPGDYLTGNTIVGTSKVIINGSPTIEGVIETDDIFNPSNAATIGGVTPLDGDYPNIMFPSAIPGTDGYLANANPYNLDIKTSNYSIPEGKYGKIETNNNNVIFDTTSGDLRIWVDTFETKNNGHIQVTGPGRVLIFVNNSITLRGDVNYKIEEDDKGKEIAVAGNPQELIIFAAPDSTVSLLKGNMIFAGHVYGPESIINFQGAQDFLGTMVGETVTVGGTVGVSGNLTEGDLIVADDFDFITGFEVVHYFSP